MEKLSDFKSTMETCNHCGQCKWLFPPKVTDIRYVEICPINQRYSYDAYSGQGLIHIARELQEGILQYEDGLIDLIYSCTTCGACDVGCKSIRDMEVMDTILALRAKCAEDGKVPPVHKQTAEKIAAEHNIYGEPHAERFSWLPADFEQDEDSDVALFVGCNAAYRNPQMALDAIKILKAGGVSFKLLSEDEFCCGMPLWRTGQIDAAAELVERNVEVFAKHGIKTIITDCAECFAAFRSGYPRFVDMGVEVLHISQVIDSFIQQGKLNLGEIQPVTVAYHDPCMLGRMSEKYVPWEGTVEEFGILNPPKVWRRGADGVYDEPRRILKAIPGVEVVEFPRAEEECYCCGGGGGVPDVAPELAAWIANERLGEAASTGASAIVSSCPFCADQFKQAAANAAADSAKLDYLDLTELVVKSIDAAKEVER